MASHHRLYWFIVIVVAAVSAIFASPYGVLQVSLLTVIVLIVGAQGIAGAESEWRPEPRPPVLRSRIVHYVRISKVKDGRRIQSTADNPFEASLLGQPGWTQLSAGELKRLGRTIHLEDQPISITTPILAQ